jgi:hypothetical protein
MASVAAPSVRFTPGARDLGKWAPIPYRKCIVLRRLRYALPLSNSPASWKVVCLV